MNGSGSDRCLVVLWIERPSTCNFSENSFLHTLRMNSKLYCQCQFQHEIRYPETLFLKFRENPETPKGDGRESKEGKNIFVCFYSENLSKGLLYFIKGFFLGVNASLLHTGIKKHLHLKKKEEFHMLLWLPSYHQSRLRWWSKAPYRNNFVKGACKENMMTAGWPSLFPPCFILALLLHCMTKRQLILIIRALDIISHSGRPLFP